MGSAGFKLCRARALGIAERSGAIPKDRVRHGVRCKGCPLAEGVGVNARYWHWNRGGDFPP